LQKILIIGNLGYLGSKISHYLTNCGYECVGADTGIFQYGVLYQPHNIRMLNKEARSIEMEDLVDFDCVLMLAGVSNDPFGNLDPKLIYDPTVDYALNIAEMCKNLKIKYIFPSSCSVYGVGIGLLNEKSETNPQTPYSENKLKIEEGLKKIADKNFSPIALRLGTVFGLSPRIRFDVVINMLCGLAITNKKIILNSNGESWRPHVYIDDVCEAFKCCIEWNYNEGKLAIINIGKNENNFKIIDIAYIIQKNVKGCSLDFLNGTNPDNELFQDKKLQDGVDKRSYQVSFDYANEIIPKFSADWNVEAGIIKLINDLKKLNLDEVKFKQRDFYRLQQMEYLFNTKQITKNLFWNANEI